MDANVLNFLISFTSGLCANLTTSAITSIYQKIIGQRPDIGKRLSSPSSPADFESALSEMAGIIEALAGNGSITIDGSVITALRSASFDHQSGNISFGNSVIAAPFLHLGGSGSGGRTDISGNTELRSSSGSGISIGKGSGIIITGGAGIKIS